jgi:hypothetical protein
VTRNEKIKMIKQNQDNIIEKFCEFYIAHLFQNNREVDIDKLVLCQEHKHDSNGDYTICYYFKIEE